MILLTTTAFLISFLIDRYRKTDLLRRYQVKMSRYVSKITEMEEERKKMEEEIKLRDEFLSIASHELKTPLTSMLMKIQILLHNIRNVSLANFSIQNLLAMLETAEEQTKRLSQMINDLLNVSLITTGKYTLELQRENIGSIVKEVLKEFSEKIEAGNYKVSANIQEQAYAVVDKLRIAQVISNLFSNAIKYGNGKPIEITVAKKSGHVVISIKDHGIGMDQEQLKRIFKLFERGQAAAHIKGLGVGLYISQQIVTSHGGKIIAESKLNKGSVFSVILPADKK